MRGVINDGDDFSSKGNLQIINIHEITRAFPQNKKTMEQKKTRLLGFTLPVFFFGEYFKDNPHLKPFRAPIVLITPSP